MLYNSSLKALSYETSKEIARIINESLRFQAINIREASRENYKYDGTLTFCAKRFTVEMKQSQKDYIYKQVKGITPHFKEQRIHKVSANHNSDIFIRYDTTMKGCIVYLLDDIDKSNTVTLPTVTEVGTVDIEYYTIPDDKCYYIDLEDNLDIRNKMCWLINRLYSLRIHS